VKPDARETVAKTFESRLSHLPDVPGFHAFQLLQSEADDGALVAMVLRDSKASYETHVASASVQEIHSGPAAEAAHAAMTAPPHPCQRGRSGPGSTADGIRAASVRCSRVAPPGARRDRAWLSAERISIETFLPFSVSGR